MPNHKGYMLSGAMPTRAPNDLSLINAVDGSDGHAVIARGASPCPPEPQTALSFQRRPGVRVGMAPVVAALITILILLAIPSNAQDAGVLLSPKAFRAAVDRVSPSLVTIEAYGSTARPALPPATRPAVGPATRGAMRPIGRPMPMPPRGRNPGGISQPGEGPTTGLIVSSDGLIITSTYNFLRGQPIITVILPDRSQHVAKVLGRDETRKICLLKIDGVKDLPVPKFVPKSEMKVGQWAISVGNGYGGDEPAVSAGIISATHRIGGRAIQTDANLSPANYGGPLIDIEGRVLGICVPLSPQSRDAAAGVEWYDSGIGFAVVANGLEDLIARMARGDVIKAGWLGILPAMGGPEGGVSIMSVLPNSPAANAGLKQGDLLLTANEQRLIDPKSLSEILATLEAGAEVTLTYRRGAEEKKLTLKLAEPPAQP